jgi:hypothetical protein
MAFSGRSSLLALVDDLIRVSGGHQVAPDTVRPVLVLEGVGGSGRSELLRHVWRLNATTTPTAMVDPLAVEGDPHSMRDVLTAVMLGLTAEVPAYTVSFPRVVLAHIAMDGRFDAADAALNVRAMLQRINTYEDHGAVVRLLRPLLSDAASYLQVPGAGNLVPAAAEEMTRRLNRAGWRAKLTWKDALEWFGHQDQDFRHDPVRALVLLSLQARQQSPSVREDVDHLLMAAFLADLRDSFAHTANRRSNAILLLDNGDAPSAREFVKALTRVRSELRYQGVPPDPLVVITTSGGKTAHHAPGWSESALENLTSDDITGAGPILRVILDGLTPEDVQQIARGRHWPETLGTRVIASAVHRLTGGHAKATDLVLKQLHNEPELIDDLDKVLASSPVGLDRRLEDHLLDLISAELSPGRELDGQLRDDLITLAAARDNQEARLLAPVIGDRVNAEVTLFTSTTLWSASGPRAMPAMAPFVRFLLLRALAARPLDDETGWCKVYGKLLAHAYENDDLGGQLHHRLALGDVNGVVRKLRDLMTELPADQWLALLDEAVATPSLVDCGGEPTPDGPPSGDREPGDRPGNALLRLVEKLHELANPLLSNRRIVRDHYRIISRSFEQLDEIELRFLDRTTYYAELAGALA